MVRLRLVKRGMVSGLWLEMDLACWGWFGVLVGLSVRDSESECDEGVWKESSKALG
jgi:hypothetical protein